MMAARQQQNSAACDRRCNRRVLRRPRHDAVNGILRLS